jgi:hypothetical protein
MPSIFISRALTSFITSSRLILINLSSDIINEINHFILHFYLFICKVRPNVPTVRPNVSTVPPNASNVHPNNSEVHPNKSEVPPDTIPVPPAAGDGGKNKKE